MRNALIVGVAVTFFGLGALLSPRLNASIQEVRTEVRTPITPKAGERLIIWPAETADREQCEVEKALAGWVRCKSGIWRNLTTGVGYSVRPSAP